MLIVASTSSTNSVPGGGAAPAAHAAALAAARAAFTPARCAASTRGVHQPPCRRQRRHRAVLGLLIDQRPDPGHTVRAVGDRRREIGEDPARVMHPRALVGVRQHLADLRRQPGQVPDLPQHPDPGMRHHAGTVGGHFDPPRTDSCYASP